MIPADARFGEAAAFFALFAQSRWASCHVRTDDLEIFVSRQPGHANPMTGEAPALAEAPRVALKASHLGTLVDVAEIGSILAPGQGYATLELLGDAIELIAEEGGTVAGHLLEIGALVEYDQPLVSLH